MPESKPIRILDSGYVKYIDHMGTDEHFIRAARQSTNKDFQGWDQDAGLLEYLYANQHHTPFEMSNLIIEVKAPIFVFREWMRHRTQSFNELSARYTVMPNDHYVPSLERMVRQDQKNKQGSSKDKLDRAHAARIQKQMEQDQAHLYATYTSAMDGGLVREVARINTPVSRYSKMWANSNLRNWLHFLNLRMAPNAQEEIRVYANAVAQIVQSIWPRTFALFEEHTLYGVRLSRTEAALAAKALEEFRKLNPEAEKLFSKLIANNPTCK